MTDAVFEAGVSQGVSASLAFKEFSFGKMTRFPTSSTRDCASSNLQSSTAAIHTVDHSVDRP